LQTDFITIDPYKTETMLEEEEDKEEEGFNRKDKETFVTSQ
jgi:hypothetical protein